MPKKTILFTESGTFGGGSFLSLLQLLSRLDRDTYDPLVAFVNEPPILQKFQDLGVETFVFTDPAYSLSIHRRIRKRIEHLEEGAFRHAPFLAGAIHRLCHGPLIRSLVRTIRERGVDLLYMNNQIDRDFFGLEVARRTGVPVISHQRSVNGEPFTPGKATAANRSVHTFIARAQVVRDYWVGLGLDPAKVELIPNGVEITDIEPMDVRAEFGLEPKRRIIGCVGRIIPEKGHLFLVDGFTRLRRMRDDVTLLILGDGPHMERVRERIEELGIKDVILAGQRSDALRLITGMDCMVNPASTDSYGRTIIEAMIAGVPVVATDTGGIREIIIHDENGMLVDHGDVDGIAQTFSELLDDPRKAERIAEAGRKTVLRNYDIEKMVSDISTVMNRAMSRT